MAALPENVFIRDTLNNPPDVSNLPKILSIAGAFGGVALLVVLLRVYVRIAMLKSIGADDWIMVAAQCFSIAVFVCFVGEGQHGLGRHYMYITPTDVSKMTHWVYFHSLIVMVGISLVKISIAFFLRRFMQSKKQKLFILCAIIFLIAFTIACAGTLIFACVPVAAYWDVSLLPNAKCFSIKTFSDIGLFNSTVNIITDFTFAILPIPIVWSLQANQRTKISLTIILSLGFFASAAAIVKTVYQATSLSQPDHNYSDLFSLWNYIELNVGILAASLPCLRPLFAKFFESTTRFMTGTSRSGGSNPRNLDYGSKYPHGQPKRSSRARQYYQRQKDIESELHSGVNLGSIHRSHTDFDGRGDKLGSRTAVTTITGNDYDSEQIMLHDPGTTDETDGGSKGILKTTTVQIAHI